MTAAVNKQSNCRREGRSCGLGAGADNYYEHFLQNSGDKFQYLAADVVVVVVVVATRM